MERKAELNRTEKLLRAAIEHDRAGLQAYGSMTNLERIGRLREKEANLRRTVRAAEKAAEARIVTPPHHNPSARKPTHLETLMQVVNKIFSFNRGNR